MRRMFERYLAEVTPHKKGADQERYVLRGFARSRLAEYCPGGLTPAAIREWRDQRLREVAPATVNRGLAVLSHVIEHARREWGIDLPMNPVASVSRPKNARGRTRRLVGDEETWLLAACAGGRAPYLRDLVLIALETAMRRSELLSLCWEDIDLERATARLRDSKNGEPRTVPLSLRARERLRQMRPVAGVGPVWPDATGTGVLQAFRRAINRAGLKDLRFHDLRHEAASPLVRKGAKRYGSRKCDRTPGSAHARALYPPRCKQTRTQTRQLATATFGPFTATTTPTGKLSIEAPSMNLSIPDLSKHPFEYLNNIVTRHPEFLDALKWAGWV